MQIDKKYPNTHFPSKVIAEALSALQELDNETYREIETLRDSGETLKLSHYFSQSDVDLTASISRADQGEEWTFDSIDEWYGAYDRGASASRLWYSARYSPHALTIETYAPPYASVTVTVRSDNQRRVERILRIFTTAAPDCKLSPPTPESLPDPPVVVFLGHGRSSDWREIKDHLQDSHNYKIEAYEVGARAGHSIRDVLTSMLDRSSFALLVMTGEDDGAEGGARARQNVVHEAGLFQGRLGFSRAIAVVENGVEVFSNLDGVQQIRYDKGNVKSTFGEILATLRREFEDRR